LPQQKKSLWKKRCPSGSVFGKIENGWDEEIVRKRGPSNRKKIICRALGRSKYQLKGAASAKKNDKKKQKRGGGRWIRCHWGGYPFCRGTLNSPGSTPLGVLALCGRGFETYDFSLGNLGRGTLPTGGGKGSLREVLLKKNRKSGERKYF